MKGMKLTELKNISLLFLVVTLFMTSYLLTFEYKLPALKNPLSKKKYLQKTCIQPKLHPFEGDFFRRFFKTVRPFNCSKVKDWLEINNGSIYISKSIEDEERRNINCSIQYVQRVDDRRVTFSKSYKLGNDSIMPLKNDFFRASCTGINTSYVNMHAGIPYKQKVQSRDGNVNESQGLGLNMLLIGFDSMSHMTYIRKLPKTYKYLKNNLKAFIMNGFNAIGDGTGENLTPLLTGKNEEELPVALKNKKGADFVDKWSFIWYDLHRYGYVTGYTEDFSRIGTYTLRLKGFRQQPTDHYMRTFYLAAEPTYRRHKAFCLGSKRRTEVLYDYIKQYQIMYRDKRKFFFSFHGELSHDSLNRVESADGDLVQLLTFLNENNFLNDTMLILFSDHGKRFGHSRAHPQGKFEQLMPFMSITLPPWFHKKYPSLVNNLEVNTNRLTTGFDVHEMLTDMIVFKGGGVGKLSTRGISLFQEIPFTRKCVHAGISEELCTCSHWGKISVSDRKIQKASEFSIGYINNMNKYYRKFCATLHLQKVTMAQSKVLETSITNFNIYQIGIQATPGGGLFEVTVKMNRVTEEMTVMGTISRINAYGNTSQCIMSKNIKLRKFCFCKVINNNNTLKSNI